MSNFGWLIEFEANGGDWVPALPGRYWKTEAGAAKAMTKWLLDQEKEAWRPKARVMELVKACNHVRTAA